MGSVPKRHHPEEPDLRPTSPVPRELGEGGNLPRLLDLTGEVVMTHYYYSGSIPRIRSEKETPMHS